MFTYHSRKIQGATLGNAVSLFLLLSLAYLPYCDVIKLQHRASVEKPSSGWIINWWSTGRIRPTKASHPAWFASCGQWLYDVSQNVVFNLRGRINHPCLVINMVINVTLDNQLPQPQSNITEINGTLQNLFILFSENSIYCL